MKITMENKYLKAVWNQALMAQYHFCPERPGCATYRLQFSFLKNPGQDEAAQRHGHDEDEGERQGCCGGLHHPKRNNTPQLRQSEHIHPPCLHLKRQIQRGVQVTRTRRC